TGGHFGVDTPARLRTWLRRGCRFSSLHRHISPCRGALDFLEEWRRVPCELSSSNARGRRSSARIKTFSLMSSLTSAAKRAPHHDIGTDLCNNDYKIIDLIRLTSHRTGAWEQRFA